MSDNEVKDVVKATFKAINTEEPSKNEVKGGEKACAAKDADDRAPMPFFKQHEIMMGFNLYRCIVTKDKDGNKKDPEINVEKFMAIGGYSKSSVSTVIGRLKKRIREIEEAKGENYKGIDTSADTKGGSKTPSRKPRAVPGPSTPKTPGGGRGKRRAADSDDEATPDTVKTKKPRASAKKVQKETDEAEGDADDDEAPQTPATPTVKKGKGKKAAAIKTDANHEGENDEEPKTPKTKKPRTPRKPKAEGATPAKGRGRKKATAEPESAVDQDKENGESSTDKVKSNSTEDKTSNGDNGNGESSTTDKVEANDIEDGDDSRADSGDSKGEEPADSGFEL